MLVEAGRRESRGWKRVAAASWALFSGGAIRETVSIACGLRDSCWFFGSNHHRSKLAANSRNTLELKTEEWVSG